MMDELRLQPGQQAGEILDGHVELSCLRMIRAEWLRDQVPGVLDKRQRLRCRRVHQDLPAIQLRPPLVIADVGVEENSGHSHYLPSSFPTWIVIDRRPSIDRRVREI